MDSGSLSGLECLKRLVCNDNGFICLKTEGVEGFKYAFYLSHPAGLEKVFYSGRKEHVFDIPVRKGGYAAKFFYKDKKGEVLSYKVSFRVSSQGEIFPYNKAVLSEAKGWRIDYYDNGSDVTFIVFNGSGSSKKSSPFGFSYLIEKGFNVVACLQENDQYQSLSFEEFKSVVLPAVKDKKVFLYGSSLGGYCAIYYAGAVNGTVIAAAPRNSAHPELVVRNGQASKFNASDFNHCDIKDNPVSQRSVFVFFDPYVKKDRFFLDEFIKPAYGDLVEVKFEHAGHEVLFHVNRTGQLDSVIMSIVSGGVVLDLNKEVDSIFTYMGKSRYFLDKKNYKRALFYSEKAIKSMEEGGVSEKTQVRCRKLYSRALSFQNA